MEVIPRARAWLRGPRDLPIRKCRTGVLKTRVFHEFAIHPALAKKTSTAPSSRQLPARHLTARCNRALNMAFAKKLSRSFPRSKNFVLVCRSDPALRISFWFAQATPAHRRGLHFDKR